MHGMIFEIYKLYLVVFVLGIMIFCVLSMYLIYKSFTINTDVTVTYSKQIKIYNFLKVNFFVMVVIMYLTLYLLSQWQHR